MKLTARVIRIWETKVDADYGEEEAELHAKAVKTAKGKPDSETAVILPDTKKGDDREEDED